MSAVPKKKLCWNCEGNISKEIDNCPYCGVYLHSDELEEDSSWNPSYRSASKKEEIPTPLYQIQASSQTDEEETQEENPLEENKESIYKQVNWMEVLDWVKQDIFPILFLMMGSVFFLFGVILFLFAQNGTLTLQWQGRDGLYFFFLAIPLIAFGWKFLQGLPSDE